MASKYSSLDELLKNNEICIPIIQRDYIQGADAKNINDVRKRLIDDFIATLKNDENILDLGIVYGINDKKKFYPVDGQQRLTTLYLFLWFLAVKADKIEKFKDLKNKLMYMTRKSAKEFFSFIVDSIVDKESKYYDEIINIINSDEKKNFINIIKSKTWFKSQWNNDITVNSAINIINDFIKLKISKNDAENYYNSIRRIRFHVLTENNDDAEKESAIRYIRMNSRGKQLAYFENVKALLEIIEDKIGDDKNKKEEQFVYQYDSKFIDVFYKKVNEETPLPEKTKIMNEQSINLLMSVYNILVFLKKESKEMIQYQKYEDYYIHVHNVSQNTENIFDIEKNFWVEYFCMLKAILTLSYENEKILKYIGEVVNNVYILNEESENNIRDNNRIVAYLRYIYYIYLRSVEETKIDSMKKIQTLEYVLSNLQYDLWDQNKFIEIDSLVKEIALCEDALIYFDKEYEVIKDEINILSNDAKILKLDINFKSIGVKDIKQRFKEISIKAKIIIKYGWDYNAFKNLEKKSKCEKIQYLIFISDMWNKNITDEKVEKLKKYMDVSNKYFMTCTNYYEPTNEEFEWRKIFAISANWDKENDTLLPCEEINENVNKNIIDNHNIWYWKDEYYFWNDEENIQKSKLKIVGQAYNLILKNELLLENNLKKFYNSILSSGNYNMCWLKYAVDRKYIQLLCSNIRYDSNKLNILFKKLDKEYNYRIYKEMFINFFSVVFYLDNKKNKNEDIIIKNLDSKSHISFDSFIFKEYIYENFTLKKDIKYIHEARDYYYQDNVNHNMHLFATCVIKTLNDSGNVFIYDNNKKIVYRCDFYNNNYSVFQYNIKEIEEKIKNFKIEVEKELEDIKSKFNRKNYDRILDINWDYDRKWPHVNDKRCKDWRYSNVINDEKRIIWEKKCDCELNVTGDIKIYKELQ